MQSRLSQLVAIRGFSDELYLKSYCSEIRIKNNYRIFEIFKHSAVISTMAGVNSKLDHELIENKNILVVEAYASCRGCNFIPRSGLLSDNELCSSCANKQR